MHLSKHMNQICYAETLETNTFENPWRIHTRFSYYLNDTDCFRYQICGFTTLENFSNVLDTVVLNVQLKTEQHE